MNTENLILNPECVNSVVESLGDIPQDSDTTTYALWVISLDDKDETVDEFFIYEFSSLEEAITKAESIDIKFISEQIESPILYYCDYAGVEYFSVEIDTVIEEEGDSVNLGTIYHRDLFLDGGEPEVEIGLDDEPIVALTAADYEILENNIIKIRTDVLKDYNKNDYVNIYFADDPDSDILECKIISKVIYEDGDYYHCELNL